MTVPKSDVQELAIRAHEMGASVLRGSLQRLDEHPHGTRRDLECRWGGGDYRLAVEGVGNFRIARGGSASLVPATARQRTPRSWPRRSSDRA